MMRSREGRRQTAVRATCMAFAQIALLFLSTAAASAVDAEPNASGKAILEKHCARCHAIDAMGNSPLPEAPALRDVYARFPIEEFEMRLSEGAVSRHREMPQIDFTSDEIASIIDYLSSLSRPK